MKELVIDKLSDNQRLDKYLSKYLSAASKSFIYKMLRKKNITLNNKKADGSEKLVQGDIVKIFFTEETLDKFTEGKSSKENNNNSKTKKSSGANGSRAFDYEKIYKPLDIVYEDEDVLLVNKPVGMLSQKASNNDISLVEYVTAYMIHNNIISYEDLAMFHPAVCNRLDRNTSGIVAAGKTMKGLQELSKHFKERTLDKYYICIAAGKITERKLVKGYLVKDSKTNKVTVYKDIPKTADNGKRVSSEEYLPIETEYIPLAYNKDITFLKIHLITGRSHQIRAHLASLSHPLVADYKYGRKDVNDYFSKKYGCKSQMLHSYETNIPDMDIYVHTNIPELFVNVLKGENLWQPGTPEDLEALH